MIALIFMLKNGRQTTAVSIEKLFPFVVYIVFRASCIAGVSAVNIELHFASDADSVRLSVVAAAPAPISVLEPSVYMCFHPVYFFSTTSLNLF